jgi:hypothetical protein
MTEEIELFKWFLATQGIIQNLIKKKQEREKLEKLSSMFTLDSKESFRSTSLNTLITISVSLKMLEIYEAMTQTLTRRHVKMQCLNVTTSVSTYSVGAQCQTPNMHSV